MLSETYHTVSGLVLCHRPVLSPNGHFSRSLVIMRSCHLTARLNQIIYIWHCRDSIPSSQKKGISGILLDVSDVSTFHHDQTINYKENMCKKHWVESNKQPSIHTYCHGTTPRTPFSKEQPTLQTKSGLETKSKNSNEASIFHSYKIADPSGETIQVKFHN